MTDLWLCQNERDCGEQVILEEHQDHPVCPYCNKGRLALLELDPDDYFEMSQGFDLD